MKNLYKALADFQQEVPIIHKDTKGFNYTYADLPKIFEVINPLLKKHRLGFSQPIDGNAVKTIIFHVDTGETIESSTSIPENVSLGNMNDFQVLGSAITYIRRYALSSILGLVTDKDNDAQGEQISKKQHVENAPLNKEKEKKWLNVGSDNWNNLIKLQESGEKWTLEGVKKHYKVSKDTQKALENLNIY